MHEADIERIARELGGGIAPDTPLERAMDRLMEVLVAVAGTRSWDDRR